MFPEIHDQNFSFGQQSAMIFWVGNEALSPPPPPPTPRSLREFIQIGGYSPLIQRDPPSIDWVPSSDTQRKPKFIFWKIGGLGYILLPAKWFGWPGSLISSNEEVEDASF